VSLKQNTEDKKRGKELKCVVGRLDRMKRGNGIKGRDDKSSGIEILMAEALPKLSPKSTLLFVHREPHLFIINR
jgi:hypothetical protein